MARGGAILGTAFFKLSFMINYKSFQQQSVKVKKVLFAGKIDPTSNTRCFVSTLLDNTSDWVYLKSIQDDVRQTAINKISMFQYSPEDLLMLESKFLEVWQDEGGQTEQISIAIATYQTLQLLKKVHINSGEVIKSVEYAV